MLLDYRYDSFGNVSQHQPNNGVWNNFTYDAQNRLLNGYGLPYTYDASGRLTGYENTAYTGYRGHGVTTYGGGQRYYYDNNGNVLNRRWGRLSRRIRSCRIPRICLFAPQAQSAITIGLFVYQSGLLSV